MPAMEEGFDRCLQRALAMLDDKGLPRRTSAPPLWKLGFRMPPPMAGFTSTAVLTAVFFGPVWT